MRTCTFRNSLFPALALLAAFLLPVVSALGAARITIINSDGTGEGFNDPTPAQPVGGNSGSTIGQQRLNAFRFAADIWGATLDSNVEIKISANFDPLFCTATSGTLGSARPDTVNRNFPGAEFGNTWYVAALADKRAARDLSSSGGADIIARFNSNLGKTNCLEGASWYYGYDTNQTPNQTNLVTVLLHEFAHGLGFVSLVDETTGENFNGSDDVFSVYTFDTTINKRWTEMTDAERKASAFNARRVVWTGANTTAAVPSVLHPGTPQLFINSPSSIANSYAIGTASFGPPLTENGITGNVVLADDGSTAVVDPDNPAPPTTTDACQPLVNSVSGSIALIDRGQCSFIVKVKNAQNAGAIAVIITDNAVGNPPPGLGGTDSTINITTVRITQNDGNRIKESLAVGTVNVTLKRDLSTRAGADSQNRIFLYTIDPVAPGSSVSHFDESAEPNLLMEPFNDDDITFSVQPPEDLTLPLFRDLGWFKDANGDNLPDDVDTTPAQFRVTTRSITRDCATGEYLVSVTVTNTGTTTANNVRVLNATLGAATISTTTFFDKLAPGQSATRTLRFPATAGNPGTRVRLSVNGADSTTFVGNNFSSAAFTSSRRNILTRAAIRVLPACRQ